MAKIKGWSKKINKKDRVYWENKEQGMLANVERVGNTWYFVKGDIKGKNQVGDRVENKKAGIDRAVKYMRFHSY